MEEWFNGWEVGGEYPMKQQVRMDHIIFQMNIIGSFREVAKSDVAVAVAKEMAVETGVGAVVAVADGLPGL